MKILILLTFISFSTFATTCTIFESSRFGSKFSAKKVNFTLEKVFLKSLQFNMDIGEYDLNENIRIRVESQITRFNDGSKPHISSILYILRHRGGNGYEVIGQSRPSFNSYVEDKVSFNLNSLFDDHSESVGYQLSEGIDLQSSTLECFIH